MTLRHRKASWCQKVGQRSLQNCYATQALILLADPQQPLCGASALLRLCDCRCELCDVFIAAIFAFRSFWVHKVTKYQPAKAVSAEVYLSKLWWAAIYPTPNTRSSDTDWSYWNCFWGRNTWGKCCRCIWGEGHSVRWCPEPLFFTQLGCLQACWGTRRPAGESCDPWEEGGLCCEVPVTSGESRESKRDHDGGSAAITQNGGRAAGSLPALGGGARDWLFSTRGRAQATSSQWEAQVSSRLRTWPPCNHGSTVLHFHNFPLSTPTPLLPPCLFHTSVLLPVKLLKLARG